VRVSDEAGALSLKAGILDLSTSKTIMSDDLADCLDVVPDELPSLNCDFNAYSDDGKYVLFVSANNAVSLFDLAKGSCTFRKNCGELMARPAFAPGNHVICVTKAGDICVLDPEDGKFVAVDEDGSASLSDELFSMDRPGAQITLSFDQNASKMYAYGVRNGKTFIRVYTISDDGILTPETEIPQAVACGSSLVLMRYGDSAAELFPYLSLDELRSRAAEASPIE
jgi:WD40 repeat protein